MGRKKIEIEYIENKKERAVSLQTWELVSVPADTSVGLFGVFTF